MPSRGRRGRPSYFEALERRQLMSGAPSFTAPLESTSPTTAAFASSDSLAGGVLPSVADIGSVGASGTFSYADGVYALAGSGIDIGGAADGFTFASAPTVQDVVVSTRVDMLVATNPGASSGVMIRNAGSAAGAPMAALLITKDAQLKFTYRASANASATTVTIAGVSVPQYLRLMRTGRSVSAAYSSDGVAWTNALTSLTINFDSGASRVGLVVASRNTAQTNQSTFSHVAVLAGGGDATWLHNDIGASTGSVGYEPTSATIELISRGAPIDGTSDALNFVSQPLIGDGSVIARVAATSPTNTSSAGVMIRADASAGSSFAAIFLTDNGSVRFAWRVSADTAVQGVAISVSASSASLKIVRDGSQFQGLYSVDGGATWLRVNASASVSIPMPTTARAGVMVASVPGTTASATFTGVGVGAKPLASAGILTGNDQLFLDDLERRTTLWFTSTQNATSGLFPDRANAYPGWLGGESSVASTGFGLSALVIGASRGWISDGYARALRTLTFLLNDADMTNPANHGFFYHFVNQTTGQRSGTSELSSIDTALLIGGVLSVGEYWKGTPLETMASQIYERVDWTFMQPNGPGTRLRHAWTPEGGFAPSTWDSWSEGPLLYLVAMGSPTHPINAASWFSFARNTTTATYAGQTIYLASGGPLFTNQYPQGWFDLRGKSDRYDADPSASRVVNIDPFQNAKTHTLLQRRASIDAAAGSDPRYDHFGPNTWGLTASDGPNGYQVSGGPPINSDGTIAPTAPGGSLAFTPRESIDALVNLKTVYPNSYRTWGFVDAFNPRPTINWYDNDALGIDQGMMLVAAENLRSGLIWRLFMSHPAAQTAVALAFTDNTSFEPPTIATSSFAFENAHVASLTFTQDVIGSLSASDFSVVNVTTGQTVPASSWTLGLSGSNRPTMATITFFGTLADGRYELRVLDGGVARTDGTINVGTLVASFFVLAGDADRDGSVTFDDLLTLARNYGSAGRTFSQGNFDYSTDGLVGFDDLLALARRYGTTLAPAAAEALSIASPTRARRSAGVAAEIVG